MVISTPLRRAATSAALVLLGCSGGRPAAVTTTPVPVDPVQSEPSVRPVVVDIEMGGDTACARRDDGAVFCWGDIYRGHTAWPRRVEGLPPVEALSVSDDHSCAIDASGDLWCWGREDGGGTLLEGAVGPGYGAPGQPHRIEGVEKLRAVSAGGYHNGSHSRTCVIGADDVLTCMRWELEQVRYEELGAVEDVAVGHDLLCVLRDGLHHCARLRADRARPSRFRRLEGANALVSVAVSGDNHSGHTEDGRLFGWGPRFCPEHRPKPGESLVGRWNHWQEERACEMGRGRGPIVALDGSVSGLIVAREGTAREWFPRRIEGREHRAWDEPFVDVAMGTHAACGLKRGGEVSCWGASQSGQLGQQTWPLGRRYRVPFTYVVAHDDQLCAVDPKHGVRCWGEAFRIGMGGGEDDWLRGEVLTGTKGTTRLHVNLYGACVDLGAPTVRCSRSERGTLLGWPVAEVQAMGRYTACSVHGDGKLRCRFDSVDEEVITVDGQPLLGVTAVGIDHYGGYALNGDGVYRFLPSAEATLEPGSEGARQLAVGRGFYCVLAKGRVRCAGYGYDGQLGDGTGRSSRALREVEGLPSVVRVRAGHRHACAVTADERLFCWGSNAFGQLGDGTRQDRWRATEVPELSGVKDASLGREGTCAQRADGSVCWGRRAVAVFDADPMAAVDRARDEVFVVEGIGKAPPAVKLRQLDVAVPPAETAPAPPAPP